MNTISWDSLTRVSERHPVLYFGYINELPSSMIGGEHELSSAFHKYPWVYFNPAINMRQFIPVGYITLVDTSSSTARLMSTVGLNTCTNDCPERAGMLLWDPACVLQHWLSLRHITVWFLLWQAIIIPMLPLISPLFGAWLAWSLYSNWTA